MLQATGFHQKTQRSFRQRWLNRMVRLLVPRHQITEVLALHLARLAGIDAAPARIVEMDGVAVAIIERFDRTPDNARIPNLSAASMLQVSRQLWRRIVFNRLITNLDDHLQNLGSFACEQRTVAAGPGV